jgi:pimeloyl-ACP methyl ester carboxylesterase
MRHFETVTSRDGTVIAYERRGHGPPLVMVHGSTVDHTRWGGVVGALAERFTLYMMDRRGLGRSGDGPVYAIEREFEDIVALLEAAPTPARLLGHSYGSVCALGAARLCPRIERMVLYEPPLPLPGRESQYPLDLSQRLDALGARGEHALVLEIFLREVLHMTEAELARMRKTLSWPLRVAASATLPREVGVAKAYRFEPASFAHVRVPTLFLYGNRSPEHLQASTRMAHAALHGSRLEVLAGHGHGAMATAPKAFLEKVLPFLGA